MVLSFCLRFLLFHSLHSCVVWGIVVRLSMPASLSVLKYYHVRCRSVCTVKKAKKVSFFAAEEEEGTKSRISTHVCLLIRVLH